MPCESELKLYCLVLDSEPNLARAFSIQIPATDTVESLKEAIKAKKINTFQHINADTLELWKVSITEEEFSEAPLHELLRPHNSLCSSKILGELFLDQYLKDDLHIIVRPPRIATSPDPQSFLVLNCLVLGQSCNNIFPVEIARTKSVGSLKQAIKGKKSCFFNDLDADDLVLWNVSEVANINLEKPLQKANFPGKESLSSLDRLSKVFSHSPVEGHLHIAVGRAEHAYCKADDVVDQLDHVNVNYGRPRKRARSSKEEEAPISLWLDPFQRASGGASIIYSKAWGKKWPQHDGTILRSQIGNVDESHDGYAYPGSDIPDSLTYVCLEQMGEVSKQLKLNQAHPDFVVVREEYRWLCERLEIDTNENVVITGQPGIGKTTFLLYLLLYRLERMLPTAIQLSPKFIFIFDEQGAQVYHCDDSYVVRLQKCWALSDSNFQIEHPCDAFISDAQRIIQVAPPKSSRWKQWLKEKGGARIFSELPKVLEIAAILKESKRDTSLALSLVGKWGPSIRTINELTTKPYLDKQFEADARKAAQEISANPSMSFTIYGTGELSNSEAARVLFIRPDRVPSCTNIGTNTPIDSSNSQLFIPTKFLTSVFDDYCSQLTKKASLELFYAFTSHFFTRSPAGWFHEKNMHNHMYNGGRPLRIFSDSKVIEMQPSSVLLAGTGANLRNQNPSDLSSFYWIPSVMNFPGIDGVLGAGKDIFTLQASISETHRSPIDGIRKTWNTVSPGVRADCTWHVVVVANTQETADNIRTQFSKDLKGLRLGRTKVIVQVWGCVLQGSDARVLEE